MQQHTASWGVESWAVASGGEALARLRQALRHGRALHIALIDRSLPDMSGEELGQRIKSDPELSSTQMVMVATSGFRGDAARVSKIGFAAYLPKPVTAATLLECLQQLRSQGGSGRCASDRWRPDHGAQHLRTQARAAAHPAG